MSLRDRLNLKPKPGKEPQRVLYESYGVLDNPFPSAGQPSGHPRLEDPEVDERIVQSLVQFQREYATQVVLIEGTQGVGKSNLLSHYAEQLRDAYEEDNTFYIIRYVPDPEPTFDAIVRRVFQELGTEHLRRIAAGLAARGDDEAEAAIESAKSHEVRIVLRRLKALYKKGSNALDDALSLGLEWLIGIRILNKHRDVIGVQFRIDTIESKTQALRDIVAVSEKLDVLRGIFLLLDELEKHDSTLSKTLVVRYLSAIRALIDALPRRLFLMLAITAEAKRRYFLMLPAMASRLQNQVVMLPLQQNNDGLELAKFYIDDARTKAKLSPKTAEWKQGRTALMTDEQIRQEFDKMVSPSKSKGVEGVLHRDFLNQLHLIVEAKLQK